jgi:hypothetical protein
MMIASSSKSGPSILIPSLQHRLHLSFRSCEPAGRPAGRENKESASTGSAFVSALQVPAGRASIPNPPWTNGLLRVNVLLARCSCVSSSGASLVATLPPNELALSFRLSSSLSTPSVRQRTQAETILNPPLLTVDADILHDEFLRHAQNVGGRATRVTSFRYLRKLSYWRLMIP